MNISPHSFSPEGEMQVTLLLNSVNHFSPHLTSKPILPFPKGRNKLLCFVKDFSKSMNIGPLSFSNPSYPSQREGTSYYYA